ncbi:hypothetical protein DUGA6_62130 [Duganella sp. HH105]|nr:hypothetical protein DUGA6_62130 [Duganella sp. HH105]
MPGQQHRRRRVLQHVGQAVGRIGRVQRHIGAASLQDAQQGYHHLQRTLHAQAHQHVRAHAQCAQVMRQAVRSRIELGIRQLFAFVHERHAVRRRCRPFLEQRRHRRRRWIIAGRVVPLHQQLMAFRCRQHVDGANRAVRRGFQLSHQLLDGGVHVFAYALRRHRHIDLCRQCEVLTQIVNRERDRIIGALFTADHAYALQGDINIRTALGLRGYAMTVVE